MSAHVSGSPLGVLMGMSNKPQSHDEPPIEVAVAYYFIRNCNEFVGSRPPRESEFDQGEDRNMHGAQERTFVAANSLLTDYFLDARAKKPWEKPAVQPPKIERSKEDGSGTDKAAGADSGSAVGNGQAPKKIVKKIVPRTDNAGGPDAGVVLPPPSAPGEGDPAQSSRPSGDEGDGVRGA